ncbi:carbohydrate ABC transporter permease [Stutzerimonas stutzeri]|uniref:Maltose/maltodextrin transport system permease protein MalG n=1 Tax=Stutzerimonas stutzeri TaxID=316 RepID=A0A6I6LHN8_STUST|nr:carbohydrate ABC transporter permease [Stutzerimonas stutzeri]QGZ30419.1 ABC transporter permease subunit [Stutzerimonas stutzeri]
MNQRLTLPAPAGTQAASLPRKAGSRASWFWTSLLILITAIVLFPVIWVGSFMFRPDAAMFARPTQWLFEPTMAHFQYVIDNGFIGYLGTSVLLASISTLLVVLLGTPAAYAFARFKLRFKDDLFLFVLATRMAPPICMVIPFYMIFSKVGLMDTYVGLTLAYLTFNLSFYIWVMSSFCKDLPVALEEVAMLEGYNRFAIFLRVVLPLLRSGIVATGMLCFIFAWNEFMFAFMLGGQEVKTLPVAVPELITTQGVRWGAMAIVGTLSLIPVMLAVFFLQKHIVRGLTMGAVKG